MSILTSLFTGVSGLGANGQALSVIGDNIANGNTVGFKGSRAVFGDVMSQALGGSSSTQIGRGASMNAAQQVFTQGNFETSANPLDMAVDGDGFFIAKEVNGGTFYTRAGQSSLDKSGYIVTSSGLRVQGYLYDASGSPTGAIGDINVATVNSNPNPTAKMYLQSNLDSRSATASAWVSLGAGSTTGPTSGTYNFNTTMTVFDTQGNDHPVSIYYRKVDSATRDNTWEVHMVYNSSNTATANYKEVGYGGANDCLYLSFSPSGVLWDVRAGTVAAPPAEPAALQAFTAKDLTLDFTAWTGGTAPDSTISTNFQYSGVSSTQYGSPSTMIFQNQDGWTSGSLRSLTISQAGVIGGVFTNGQVKNIAQVAVAKFIAPGGLTKMGRNLFAESFDSGQPVIGTPGSSGRGNIMPNSVELSNVDLADEFVKMIAAQRGFQANTKVITSSDAMLSEIMNIIR